MSCIRVCATGASVLALFQNLFGLAAGPFIRRVIGRLRSRDALTVIPAFGLLAAFFHSLRVPTADIHQVEDVHVEVDRSGSVAQPATFGLDWKQYERIDDAAATAGIDAANPR